jgi:signal transduction histidine kinase/CheY-like chemotaxis protein/uncharacterized membrane protein YfcA
MAIVYITSIRVDLLTLVVPIVAQVLGAHVSARFVVKMPVRPIRVFLAVGMVVTVLRIVAEGFGFFPAGGEVTGLGAGKLVLLGGLCLVYGALNNTGIGSYAPTIATVSALGLNPEVAFTIMMGAATFSVPAAGIQFIRHDAYSRKIALISTVCGTLGVLAAAFALQNLDISPLKWLVALFLLHSAGSMLLAAFRDREDSVAEPGPAEPEQAENALSIVGRLTSFSLAMILVCAVSLVMIFFRNVHVSSSDYVEANIKEHNARLRDGVQAYLRAHEIVLLSARAGAARLMSENPVKPERLRAYLEESSRTLGDISLLYCSTNEAWNQPGGYAVFSRPWNPPPDWNNRERPWFIAAKNNGGKIAYSKPYTDAFTGGVVLGMSVNIYDAAGNDIGVVSEDIAIESLNAMLRNTAAEGQRIFLIDGEGSFIVHPDRETAAQGNFFTVTGLEEYRGDILSSGHFSAENNGLAVYSSSIPAAGWIVVSIIPMEKIFSSARDHVFGIVLAPMLIIIFMLLAVFISLLIRIYRESKDKLTAERLAVEKNSFIARMSHEMRTPLNAVIGMSELADRDYGTPEAQEYVRGIKTAGVSLRAIINDILDFSKLESGSLSLAVSPYETGVMLRDVLAIIRFQTAEKRLELLVEADPGLPRAVVGDAGRVKQVLLNLLGNAVKYTGEGFIRFSVSGERLTENAARLTFAVEDSGLGIRPEDMPKLFGDFARLDEKRNSAIEGTGLGLSIARRLCRDMGGDVTAASVYGEGSVFTAVLIQTVSDWRPLGRLEAGPAAGTGRRRITFIAPEAAVLAVDDFPSNLAVAEGLLRPYKLRVDTCRNGREAVELVQARSFDLVLMDHMMPEMDGLEAAQAIRALGGRFADLPIVALTAHAVSGMKEMFLAGGFDDFLPKPVETAALDAVLRRWIPAAKQQGAPEDAGEGYAGPPGLAKEYMGLYQLNLLNHFRWHFVNGPPADQAYCERFSALLESMDVPAPLREAAMNLAAAGRRGDAEEIGRLLPDVYEALAAGHEEKTDGENARETLMRLKTALDQGGGPGADAALDALRGMDGLSGEARELYFFLNDALLMGETEKASAKLAEWLDGRRFS